MRMRSIALGICWALLGLSAAFARNASQADGTHWQSHPPNRPLPQPGSRKLATSQTLFVSPNGNDSHDGQWTRPWKTVGYALMQLKPGDTLYLRGGIYHEHLLASLAGREDAPIAICGYPGELAILDGGIPEFLHHPETAWEPCADGATDEFVSTGTYPNLEPPKGDLRVSLLGHFADSMTPLHGYWNRGDLQSDNPYFNLNDESLKSGKVGGSKHVYCGPGLWYNDQTDRIHCRLAHTRLPGLKENNYRGETDPRKIPLIIAGWSHGSVLTLRDSKHVILQDLVVRGARLPTLTLERGGNLLLDGLTIYGGQAPVKADGVRGLRMCHTACRGLAAPWTFRGSLKYRSIESRLLTTGGWEPSGRDGSHYEIAYCEFTDSVDGVFIGNIETVVFHHNLLENVSDDGMFVTATTSFDGRTSGGNHRIFQNRFARCLTTFAFGVGHGRQRIIADAAEGQGRWGMKQLGGGLTILRNVFDFRQRVHYYWPTGPEAPQEVGSFGRFAGDHGSPGWEPMVIAQNTLLTGDPPRYEYATDGFSRAAGQGTSRIILNNIVVQRNGLPGQTLPDGRMNYRADGNLLWSLSDGADTATLPKPKYPRDQTPPRPEWTRHDQFADPRFKSLDADWRQPADLRLSENSPAINRGVLLPPEIREQDPLASGDAGLPDIGAIPYGTSPWRVGCHGRLLVTGDAASEQEPMPEVAWVLPLRKLGDLSRHRPTRVAIVTGYPAFEAPLVSYALRGRNLSVDEFSQAWLPVEQYSRYQVVVIDGSFVRGRISPSKYSPEDLRRVRLFLESGGTLWLFRERFDLFASPEGQQMLKEIGGIAPRQTAKNSQILQPEHPWVSHLQKGQTTADWMSKGSFVAWPKAEVILGTLSDQMLLGRLRVGRGQVIYTGWGIAASLPHGRIPPTVADEQRFLDQMEIINRIADELATAPEL